MTQTQPLALPPRRGLRRFSPALVGLITFALVFAAPSTAQAAGAGLNSVTANPANVALLAEAAAMEGGTVAAGTTTAASTATMGSAAGNLGTAVNGAKIAKAGMKFAQRGLGWVNILASVGGLFGLSLDPDPDAPSTGPGGAQVGWTNGNVFLQWAQNGNGTTSWLQDLTVSIGEVNPDGTFPITGAQKWRSGSAKTMPTVESSARFRVSCQDPALGSSGGYFIAIDGLERTSTVTSTACQGSSPVQVVAEWLGEDGFTRTSVYRFNPPREQVFTVFASIRCRPAGGGPVTEKIVSANFLPGQKDSLPIPDVECATGSVLVESHGWIDDPSTPEGKDEVLWDYVAPDWVPKLADEAPSCFTDGAACVLTVKKKLPNGQDQDCFAQPGLCTGWIAEVQAGATNYSCWFGPYRQPIERCFAYPDPGKAAAVPTVDPTGKPKDPTDPASTPAPAPSPGGAGNPTDAEGAQCFPTGWGMLNPVEWVYKPVKCALVWAFVPSAETTDSIDGIGTALQGKTPFPQARSAYAWLHIPAAGTQCFTVDLKLPALLGGTTRAIDSCGDDLFIRWLRDHRQVLEVVVWVGVLSPFAWWAWREYAPGAKGVA